MTTQTAIAVDLGRYELAELLHPPTAEPAEPEPAEVPGQLDVFDQLTEEDPPPMSTTTARDSEGRSHNAPAWSGEIATLTDDQLHERIEALGAHIGRLSAQWSSSGWYPRPDFTAQAEPWVRKRLACLDEKDRREDTTR